MRSFHHSRGRVFFEVLCALGISASCVGAWMQTGALALLPAAAIAALYGLVHAFDMMGRRAEVAAPAKGAETVADQHNDPVVTQDPVEPPTTVEPETPRASKSIRAKAPRKSGNRRAKTPKEPVVAEPETNEDPVITELAPPEEIEAAVESPPEEIETAVESPPEEIEAAAHSTPDEETHAPVVPLFESDPFVRQQRQVFGRKAG